MPTPIVESKSARDFEKLVTWSAAFSIAVTAALLASLKQINPNVQFRFSVATVVAFFAAGTFTVLFFRTILHGTPRRRFALLVVAGIAAVVGYFVFGLKEVSAEKRTDVAIGAAIAVAVLSFFGWVWWRIVRFLEADDRQNRNPD
jgi:peptidoglycan/LPS O-acetylase OafA/YrhL